jgi:hypothetical protein
VTNRPVKTSYLRFGEAERPIMGPAVEIVGNAKALLQPVRPLAHRALPMARWTAIQTALVGV